MPEGPPRLRAPLSKGSRLLLALAALGFVGAGLYLIRHLDRPAPEPQGEAAKREVADPAPPIEPAPEEPVSEPAPDELPLVIVRQPPPGPGGPPKIALVIDDLGRSLQDLDTLAALDVPVTYAVLPYETRTPEVVHELHRRGASRAGRGAV